MVAVCVVLVLIKQCADLGCGDLAVLLRQRGKIVFVATRFKTAVWYACYDTIDSLTGLAILQCLLFEGILRFSPVC